MKLITGLIAGAVITAFASGQNNKVIEKQTSMIVYNSNDGEYILKGGRIINEKNPCIGNIKMVASSFNLPKDRVTAIALTETGRWNSETNRKEPWPWTINVGGKGYFYNTKNEAVLAAGRFLASGQQSIDVGCMQINLKAHPKAFETLDQAFDPYENVLYAVEFLVSLKKRYLTLDQATRCYHNCADKGRQVAYLSKVYTHQKLAEKF